MNLFPDASASNLARLRAAPLIDADYIEQTIASYVEASHFLAQIGVDGVDLKFCHGYLGSQLLRRLTTAAGNMAVRLKTAPGSRTNSAKKYAVPYRMKSF